MFYPNSHGRHGLGHQCKNCQRDRLFQRAYGITLDDYNTLFEDQGGCCAICGVHETELTGRRNGRRLHVDHCHEKGKVRGLLCGLCNPAIGGLKHDKDVLLRAIDYLERTK